VTDKGVVVGEEISVDDIVRVAREDAPVSVADGARQRVIESRERVESVTESDEAVYGINTGFGELVTERIPREDLDELQENLVRSHASGTGRELDREEARAMLVSRLHALSLGYSGVREQIIDHLMMMLNNGIHPVVRSRGSLGASGDLAPLAHLALVLIGEGEADVEDTGERLSGEEALERAGLDPIELAPKEGLALINGTQLTVGLAALAVADAEQLLDTADAAGALTTEVAMGTTVASSERISDVRPHPGQKASAANVRRLTEDSEIVESHRNCDRIQDAYSLRCLPQVHGAVREAIAHLQEAVAIELNSATDNPLIFDADSVSPDMNQTEQAAVVSGGNFHGAPLAHRLDYAANALTDLAAISERRIDRLLNPNIQEPHLPPFLADESGLESGMMIPQYTAATLINEARAQGTPATDNIPVSGNQEDHVSMSATAAFGLCEQVDRLRTVLAIELLCAAEAAEYVDDELAHGVGTAAVYETIRDHVDALDGDRSLSADIDTIGELIADGTLQANIRDALGEELRDCADRSLTR